MILFIVTTESTVVQKHSETLEKYDYFYFNLFLYVMCVDYYYRSADSTFK